MRLLTAVSLVRVQQGEFFYKVKAVDTTAAGDTFCGYFLSGITKGREIPEILKTASAASAIAVSRNGAAPSIPEYDEVETFVAKRK